MQTVTVHDTEIPALGFGTFEIDDRNAADAVANAIDIGYRHIDTAQVYENERGVGRGIRDAGIGRDDLFLTTKVWIDRFEPEELLASVDESLDRLQTEYVDLLLLHWPNPSVPLKETLSALNEVHQRGSARSIGVSNFTVNLIHQAAELSDAPLVTNQVEYHPFLDQQQVLDALDEESMALTAYSPLARGRIFKNPTLQGIAGKRGRSIAQVALAWLLAQDQVVAIPKASQREHARDNFGALDLNLSDEDLQTISGLSEPDGRVIDPDFAPDWD